MPFASKVLAARANPRERLLRRFRDSEDGVVAIIATLVMPVLLALTAVTVDYTNAARLQSAASTSLDASLLAAATSVSRGQLAEADIEDFVNEYFEANVLGRGLNAAEIGRVSTSYNEETGIIHGQVEAVSEATFSQIINPNGVRVGVDAEVTVTLLNVELALVLDVTGSMRGSKLRALQDASNALIDTLLPEGAANGPADVRISLVPYSDLVNVGDFEEAITGYDSGESCVYERGGGFAFVDDEPIGPVAGTGTDDDGFVNYAPWGSGNRSEKTIINHPSNFRGYRCSNPELMPLTSQRDELRARIGTFTAGGWTAGHIGIQWGWYTLSPEFAGVWPVHSQPELYSEEETLKVMVVMTDGAFNTWYENGIGNSFSQGEDLCDAIRATNIQIFTVGFRTRRSEENFLRSCASGPDNYFDANSQQDLIDAFQRIGQQLTDIRLAS